MTARRERNSERSRQDILQAAERQFAEKGFYGARVDEIAADAAINKRMIYEYFGSKELLYKQVLFQVYRRLETAEMLTVRTAEHNGRLRKYYHLTPQGLARIEQFKTEWEQIVNIYQFILSTEGTEHDES